MIKIINRHVLFLFVAGMSLSANGQSKSTVFPPWWWQGMANDTLEIMVYHTAAFTEVPQVKNGPEMLKAALAPNPQYAYLTLKIGTFSGSFTIKAPHFESSYEIKKRVSFSPRPLRQKDALYLITPDRFANGDPTNDEPDGMQEKNYNRDDLYSRHGGDIQGIINKLDYIQNTGFTSLWINPLLTNDQPQASYHGYAITDHYHIDPRYGSNALYAKLVDEMHRRGMKMIMDVVYNHVGSQHLLYQNPPDKDFFHYPELDTAPRTNYRAATLFDPYASQADIKLFNQGWFDYHMPDVNQSNPHMARFLIQNSIWWIEAFQLDGFRIDTYTYSHPKFTAALGKRIKEEYPEFFSFGEVWVHGPEIQSYFAGGNRYNPLETYLDGVADFQLYYAINEALNQEQGWTEGIARTYYCLAGDYLYQNPENLVTFLDNHDEGRFFGHIGESLAKYKIGLGMLYTLRGIPCTYYGTEILMKETANHGVIREDFPGGWLGDARDKFTERGRTDIENEAYQYMQKLLQWRSQSQAIAQGSLTHFVPKNGLYVYSRTYKEERVLVLVNTNAQEPQNVAMERFREIWPQGTTGRDVLTGKNYTGAHLTVPALSILILESKP
mgnify:CR=1 FL=1